MKLSQVLAIIAFVSSVAAAPIAGKLEIHSLSHCEADQSLLVDARDALDAREPTKVKVDRNAEAIDKREPTKVKVDKREPTKVKVDKREPEAMEKREPTKVKVDKREPTKVKVARDAESYELLE
ncbi:hypothetical protein ACMFMG_012077 [Clarireedia jacksonii]